MQPLSVSLAIVICSLTSSTVSGKLCPTKTYSLLDTISNDHIICPQPEDPEHWTECCGTESSRRCCPHNSRLFDEGQGERNRRDFFGDDDDDVFDLDVDDAVEGIGKFIAIIITIIIFIFVVVLLCCCCLPCCLCAKMRTKNRAGVIHSGPPAPAGAELQTGAPGVSPSQYPTQHHAPAQYPLHQVPPAQPQPYSDLPPPYPGPPAQGYPPVMSGAPGYPPQVSEGYPPVQGYPPAPGYGAQNMPEYQEKQPAFNPNMQ